MDLINQINKNYIDDLENTYKYIKNELVSKLCCCSINELQHIILYGREGSFKNFYAYWLIKNITGYYNKNIKVLQQCINVNNNTVEFNVIYSSNYLEIDLSLYSHYDKWIISDYIKNIIQNTNIIQERHIILIKNFDKVSNGCYFVLRRIIEKYTSNALFIFVANSLSSINEAILSRTLCIRCPILCDKDFKKYCRYYITDNNLLKNIINKSGNNIEKFILLNSNEEFRDNYKDNLKESIETHFKLLKKSKDIFLIAKTNREFLFKILHLNYNEVEIINTFVKIFIETKKFTDDQKYKMIEISAKTDVAIKSSSKDNFAYEKFLLETYRIIHFE